VHFGRASKKARIQELVTHSRIERLDPRILRRLAWIDKVQVDGVLNRPIKQRATCQFWSVVNSQT